MMRSIYGCFALAAFTSLGAVATAATPAINDAKYGGNANSVSMTVLAKGDLEPMTAVVTQRAATGGVILDIVEGGKTNAMPVEIARGTCDKIGPAQYRLPPFTGGQYVTTLKGAQLAQLEDGNHAIVVYGGHRSQYACGTLVKPNVFRH